MEVTIVSARSNHEVNGAKSPFFSICVPCYNAGDALRGCLSSIAAQDYDDYEVVVIDDGSEDPVQCDDYDGLGLTSLRVIRIENSGPYAARRIAFDSARGEVLLCVDADDGFADERALFTIRQVFRDINPDVVIFNATCDGANRFLDFSALEVEDGYLNPHSVNRVFATDYCLNSLWSKAFKRKLYAMGQKGAELPKLLMAEDRLQSLEIIANAGSFTLVDEPLYFYRENAGSTTHSSYKPEYFFQSCYVEERVWGMLSDLGVRSEDWAVFFLKQISSSLQGICCNRDLSWSQRHEVYKLMSNEPCLLAAFRYGNTSILPFPMRVKLALLRDQRYSLLDACMFPRAAASFVKHITISVRV